MDFNKIWEKLRDDFLAVIIGVIVSLPAIGVIVPKTFAILAEQNGIEMPGLFKIFSMVYFTMPLIILFVLSFFQFSNDVFVKLKKMILGIIGLIFVVFVVLLLPIWTDETTISRWLNITVIITLLLLIIYWYFFNKTLGDLLEIITTEEQNIHRTDSRIKKLNNKIKEISNKILDINISFTEKEQAKIDKKKYYIELGEIKKQNEAAKINLSEAYVSIKLSFFYLFIAAQLTVVIFITLFNKIFDNNIFIFLILIIYAAVVVYYMFNGNLRKLRRNEISNPFFKWVLISAVISTGLVFYVSKNKADDNISRNKQDSTETATYLNKFHGIDTNRIYKKKIEDLDVEYRAIRTQSTEDSIDNLPFKFLSKLLSGKVTSDSINSFNIKVKYCNTIADSADKKDLNLCIKELLSSPLIHDTLAKTTDPKLISSIINKIKKSPAYINTKQQILLNQSTSVAQLHINRAIRNLWFNKQNILNDDIKKNQIKLVKDTQHAGIIIFITTLIVMLSFLLILSYKNDKYELDTLDEVQPIKKIIQGICIVIAILLIPLIKMTPEDQVVSGKPSSIFLVGNWNLSKSIPEDEEGGEPKKTKKQDPGSLDPYGKSCCCCTGGGKAADSTGKAIVESINTLAQSVDSNSSELVKLLGKNRGPNPINITPPDNHYKELADKLEKIGAFMDKTNKAQDLLNQNLKNFTDSAAKLNKNATNNLSGIKNYIQQSQFKTKKP
ncbi:hypothetical protein [Mucilaginibacter jinjuensis]|uniref:Uncharacterized protein n=1 Tax=Mucilaginibacter jinjuensis TaxID=1176721 RepID=A0ABY7TC25_9SPHI|nr:hypothetical protein [Mucilaginibacter jinjuensis]WCT13182.1 hypothetical protein PQO05_04445 [Mucilaginibacter jinjuensis]